jgi:Membrane magnesium transporter
LGSPLLRPIEWAAWAGQAEQDTRRPKGKKRFENDGGAEGVSMAYLEDRKGFIDIRVGFSINFGKISSTDFV